MKIYKLSARNIKTSNGYKRIYKSTTYKIIKWKK